MTKFKKFLAIIALAVFCLTFFVGCGLFVLNEERYRDQEALTVGDEVITLGEVIDYFDANGANYVNNGYTMQETWDMLFPVFVQQKVMLNEYKANNDATNKSTLATSIGGNAGYLDDDTLKYIQKSVYVSFYESLDSLVMSTLKEDFTFEAEETKTEYPEMIDNGSDYTPAKDDARLDNTSLDKSLENYLDQGDFDGVKYVFAETDKLVIDAVADLNARLVKENSDDKDVTVADYIKAQNSAISTTTKNLKNNRDMTVAEYLDYSINKQIESHVVNKHLQDVYTANQGKVTKQLFEERYNNLIAQDVEKYTQTPSAFTSFITGLSDSDFVYYVPQQYQGEYYYVRSILVPFSDEQTESLTRAKNQFGSNSKEYLDYRESLVSKLEIKDKDGNVVAKSAFDTEWKAVQDKDDFLTLTYKYNTDPGMQNPVHSYVVSKSATDLGFGGTSFVKEFAEAARVLVNGTDLTIECVTDYGVHIIFNDGEVKADQIKWDDRNNYGVEGGSASWRFFQDMYQDLKDLFADDEIASLYNDYKEDGKIVINNDVIKQYTDTIDVEFKN